MNLSKIKFNQKFKDFIFDSESELDVLEGSIRSGKSVAAIFKFILRVMNNDEKDHIIAGRESTAAMRNLIESSFGVTNLFGPITKVRANSALGTYVELKTPKGNKNIYIVGFKDKTRWEKILGSTIGCALLDEVNLATMDFFNQVISRTASADKPYIVCTLNPDDPDLQLYKDYLNKARPLTKWKSEVPFQIMDELDKTESKENYRYWHFNFYDNPAMTEDKINRQMNSYPLGSRYYNAYILGLRVPLEGLIYAESMNIDKNIIKYDTLFKDYIFSYYTLGIDVGFKDYTVITLNGFTKNFQEMIVIDYMKINESGTDEIYNEFKKWYDKYDTNLDIHKKMYGAFTDPGGGGLILLESIKYKLLKDFNIQITTAKKSHTHGIKERIDAGIKLLHAGRLLFTNKAIDIYKAFEKALYVDKAENKSDPRQFKDHFNKDLVDATEYGMSPYMIRMINR